MARRPGTRRWDKMGVELEGGWNTNTRDIAAKVRGSAAKGDGSVRVNADYTGEITTRPHKILDTLLEEIEKLHPTVVDESCGYHIHTSFDTLDYSALADRAFWAYFLKRWEAWGKQYEGVMTKEEAERFWWRFEGKKVPGSERNYCERSFIPDEQLQFHRNRYTMLNFTAWSKFQTLECRMLPMFATPGVTILATREMSDIYDSYLNEYDFPEIKFDREVVQLGEQIIETEPFKMPISTYWEESVKRPMRAPIVGPDVFYDIPGAHDFMLPWVTSAKDEGD